MIEGTIYGRTKFLALFSLMCPAIYSIIVVLQFHLGTQQTSRTQCSPCMEDNMRGNALELLKKYERACLVMS
jgi:hypothetical protein